MAFSGIAPGDIVSLVENTRQKFAYPDFFSTFGLSAYPFVNNFMGDALGKMAIAGSRGPLWTVRTDGDGPARWTQPWATDSIVVEDAQVQGSEGWTFGDTHWAMDEREDIINSGSEALVKTMQVRRAIAMESAAEKIEYAAASTPPTSTDTKTPKGLPYGLCMGPTGSYTAGYKGQTVRFEDGSTSDVVHNINRANYERLRNWTALHQSKVDESFITTFRQAMGKSRVTPPTIVKDGQREVFDGGVAFMGEDMYLKVCARLDKTNSNFGMNLTSVKSGVPMFQNIPMHYWPALDPIEGETHVVRSYSPIYVANTRKVHVFTLGGKKMFKERKTIPMPDNHNGAVTFVDYQYQIATPNPRYAGFVLHTQIS